MENKKFTNRPVDKLPLKKSKQYLLKFIQSKVMKKKTFGEEAGSREEAGESFGSSFANFFKSLFAVPQRWATAGVVSTLVIIALVFGSIFGGWFDVVKIETVHASFDMVAEYEDGSGVAPDSAFTLTASENLDEKLIAENLKVMPEVELDVKKIGTGKYEIMPVDDLDGNRIYQFTIKSENGEYSWVYQVQDTFKITGTLPGNKSNRVPVDTGIEVNFSHENYDFSAFKDHFEITPEVKGTFEQHRNVAVFVPAKPLQEGTIYTVKIKKGLAIKDSDKKLEEDFVFQFETNKPGQAEDKPFAISFTQPYNEVGTKSAVGMGVYAYDFKEKSIKVQVYKYKDADQYLEELKKTQELPSWSYFQQEAQKYKTDHLENAGSFDALVESNGYYNYYVYLPNNTFEAGQYLFQLEHGGNISQTLVQVTDVTSYINVSITDTLIWVNDLVTGKSVKGAKIEINGVDETFETGKDGVVKFKTPEEWKQDQDDYLYEGRSAYVKITSPDGKILFSYLFLNYYGDESQGYWQSSSTDRPVYKPTDKVQFFGFLKPRGKGGDLSSVRLELVKDWDTFVKDVPIKFEKDGTFIGSVDIKNFDPGYYYLKLYQGKQVISQNGFEVADYVKPAFNLVLTKDKNAVFAGEMMTFHVKSQFFDGTPVANLEVSDNGEKGVYKTNEKGEAKVSIKAEKEQNCENYDYSWCTDTHSFYYNISSNLAEETKIDAYDEVRIFDSHLNIDGQGKTIEEDGKMLGEVKVKVNWIDLSRLNNDEKADYNDYLGDPAKDRIIDGDITEISWKKIEEGQRYNFITKKVEKLYRYEKVEKKLEGFRLQTDENGEILYKFEINSEKYYQISLYGPDDKGNRAHGSAYVYGELSRSANYDYYGVKILNGETEENYYDWWSGVDHKFDIGDTVEAAITNNEVPLDKGTKGVFLFQQEANGLQEYEVTDSPYYSFKFSKDDIPDVYIDSVWFNGLEYITPWSSGTAKYKREIQKLNIEIEGDQKEYLPGEEVTLDVKVTDSDGEPAKAKVNLNLVDEAYYKVSYDNFIDPLTEIYQSNGSGVFLTYYSHVNPLLSTHDVGGKGGCFTGETQITMADGTTKAIKDIQKGDKILTKLNEYSSELVPAEVTGLQKKFVSEYLVINDSLEVTEEHIVFANGAWTRVSDLKVGDSLLSQDGRDVKIASIRRVVKPVWVYNIEIKGAHTYMAGGFYVHNQKGDGYVRQDFKDTAMFDVIDVGANGRGKITFKLPDNITSWRVMAKAIDTDKLRGGAGTSALTVTMPFFVDLIMNREYSVKDKPMVKFRAYGDELRTGQNVVFKPEFDGKKDESAVVNGKAFTGSYYTLPKLEIGKHDVTVRAESGKLTDNLKESFEVKGSRLKKDVVKNVRKIDEKTIFELGKEGPTEIKLVDGGLAYYYEQLWFMTYGYGDRLDQKIPQIAAAELLKKYFGDLELIDLEKMSAEIMVAYQRGDGLSLLPYSSDDLRLTALIVAMDSDPQRYSVGGLKNYFYPIYQSGKSNLDELVYSLLGLASIKEPVLLSLREIQNEPKLTVEQKLYIALAFQNLGSNKEALAIFEEVYGKLAIDDDYQGVHETALGAVVAAGLNLNSEAEKLWKFVEFFGFGKEDVTDLYELGYVRNSLRHANFSPAEFKIKVGEHEETVKLKPYESKEIVAFPGDNVEVNVVQGEVAAVSHYQEFIEPSEFKKDQRLSITRKYYVNDKETTEFKEGDVVKVVITLDVKGSVDKASFQVTDVLPSGLYPMTSYYGINGYYDEGLGYPYGMNGQQIQFCWYPYFQEGIANVTNPTIKYYARVVNPGEFYAEPAKIESFYDNNIANISEPSVIKIKPISE